MSSNFVVLSEGRRRFVPTQRDLNTNNVLLFFVVDLGLRRRQDLCLQCVVVLPPLSSPCMR